MEQSQGEILPNLLIDTCGWVAVVDSRMNIDLEINRTIGPSHWILPSQVKLELEKWEKNEPIYYSIYALKIRSN